MWKTGILWASTYGWSAVGTPASWYGPDISDQLVKSLCPYFDQDWTEISNLFRIRGHGFSKERIMYPTPFSPFSRIFGANLLQLVKTKDCADSANDGYCDPGLEQDARPSN